MGGHGRRTSAPSPQLLHGRTVPHSTLQVLRVGAFFAHEDSLAAWTQPFNSEAAAAAQPQSSLVNRGGAEAGELGARQVWRAARPLRQLRVVVHHPALQQRLHCGQGAQVGRHEQRHEGWSGSTTSGQTSRPTRVCHERASAHSLERCWPYTHLGPALHRLPLQLERPMAAGRSALAGTMVGRAAGGTVERQRRRQRQSRRSGLQERPGASLAHLQHQGQPRLAPPALQGGRGSRLHLGHFQIELRGAEWVGHRCRARLVAAEGISGQRPNVARDLPRLFSAAGAAPACCCPRCGRPARPPQP